jgi:hypothetical protein
MLDCFLFIKYRTSFSIIQYIIISYLIKNIYFSQNFLIYPLCFISYSLLITDIIYDLYIHLFLSIYFVLK